MFRFIYKSLHPSCSNCSTKSFHFFNFRSISSTSKTSDSQSLTVSYLVNSCGLSLESAVKASKLIKIDTIDRPNLVIELLKAHGFTKTHISRLITKNPALILNDLEKVLKPKIEFFESLGLIGSDLPNILCSNKQILQTGLKSHVSIVDYLKGFVGTNENVIYTLKQSSRVIRCNVRQLMEPNIATLLTHGVPESHIGKLMMMQPLSLMLKKDLFDEVANAINQMGFNPLSRSYILAIRTMSTVNKEAWEKKYEVLIRFGWSKDEFSFAFKVQPAFMLTSEKKIEAVMDFLVNKVLIKPSNVARCPNLFLTSVDKRLKPRCAVLEILTAKDLISNKKINVLWALNNSKKRFEMKYLNPFKHEVPEVMKAYQGKSEFQGLIYQAHDGNLNKEAG